MRVVSHDPTCRATIELADGSHLTAVELQWEFLRLARKYADDIGLDMCGGDDVGGMVLDRWERGLAALESDPMTLDGAILRVDPVTGAGLSGNPMFGSADANARRIIAAGLRNPFRFTFRPGTDEIWVGDVGQGLIEELDFVELHDAYTSSEIQTYEDLGLCRYGEGGRFVEEGNPFMPGIDYGLTGANGRFPLTKVGTLPVNPSGGLLACGHSIGATGLMQSVFAFWQLQGRIKNHLGSASLQVKNPKRGLIHSHAGTGTYITVTIMEKT